MGTLERVTRDADSGLSAAIDRDEYGVRRRPPDNEANVEQSAASRATIEEYLRKTKTTLWIEHDFVSNAKLKKSPAFYD